MVAFSKSYAVFVTCSKQPFYVNAPCKLGEMVVVKYKKQ